MVNDKIEQTQIQKMFLKNYKGFENFSCSFNGSSYLIGPNNAGKSTIIQAIRGCAHMIGHALSKKPTARKFDRGAWRFVYPFATHQFLPIAENIKYEFLNNETRIELIFTNKAKLFAIWPADGSINDVEPFFYLELPNGKQPSGPAQAKQSFQPLGIVPILTPIEHRESILSNEQYVRDSVDTRRSSRQFRNQIYFLLQKSQKNNLNLDDFLSFVYLWTPEIKQLAIETQMSEDGSELNLYYQEKISRVQKELSWIGDGMQIWLQILFHIYRLRNGGIIIFDEPDVYLHADLQRRLVRIFEDLNCQIIIATHSAEVLGEADNSKVLWVERTRRSAVLAPEQNLLNQLSLSLGTQFNLRLARALRSRVVLFVEGNDMKIIQYLAKRIGANKLSLEDSIAIIPLIGFSNWNYIEPFSWIIDNFLEHSVSVFAIFDRDYRTDGMINTLKEKLSAINVDVHVWLMKELENYLLVPVVISRISGADENWIIDQLEDIANGLEHQIRARINEQFSADKSLKSTDRVRLSAEASSSFSKKWNTPGYKLSLCPPKEVLPELNKRLLSKQFKTIGFLEIAKNIRSNEINNEMIELFLKFEKMITSPN